jgi:hypothetical protein
MTARRRLPELRPASTPVLGLKQSTSGRWPGKRAFDIGRLAPDWLLTSKDGKWTLQAVSSGFAGSLPVEGRA